MVFEGAGRETAGACLICVERARDRAGGGCRRRRRSRHGRGRLCFGRRPRDGRSGSRLRAGRETVDSGLACVDGRATVPGAGVVAGAGLVTEGAAFVSGAGRVTARAGSRVRSRTGNGRSGSGLRRRARDRTGAGPRVRTRNGGAGPGRSCLVVPPEIAAVIHRLPVCRREFLTRTRIPIRHSLAMFGAVSPGRCLDLPCMDDRGCAVDVDGPVHVDIDVAMSPVPTPPAVIPGRCNRNARHRR